MVVEVTLVSASGKLQPLTLQEEEPLELRDFVFCYRTLHKSSDVRVLQTFVMHASVACYLEEN